MLFLRERRTRGSEDENGEQARRQPASATLLLMDLCRIGGAVGDDARLAPTNVRFSYKADIRRTCVNVR